MIEHEAKRIDYPYKKHYFLDPLIDGLYGGDYDNLIGDDEKLNETYVEILNKIDRGELNPKEIASLT
jgi:hypothetical protein